MDRKFYIADLHFNHAHAIAYDGRPFSSMEEMNEKLIGNWNNVVGKRDTVYVIGDFIWSKQQYWPNIIERLKGNIVLIRGNHDSNNLCTNTRNYFADVKDYKEIFDMDKKVIMCHYPIPFYKNDFDDNTVMLYGHVHNSTEYKYLEKLKEDIKKDLSEKAPKGNFINVGCMMPYMGYTPRTLQEILDSNG